MTRENEMREDFEAIWRICYVPSKEHPKGAHAYTHFMSNFDQIRTICSRWATKPTQQAEDSK